MNGQCPGRAGRVRGKDTQGCVEETVDKRPRGGRGRAHRGLIRLLRLFSPRQGDTWIAGLTRADSPPTRPARLATEGQTHQVKGTICRPWSRWRRRKAVPPRGRIRMALKIQKMFKDGTGQTSRGILCRSVEGCVATARGRECPWLVTLAVRHAVWAGFNQD